MGGARWCKNCHSTHEGPTGNKCQRFNSGSVEDLQVEGAEFQASNVTDNETTISQEQARLVVQHMEQSAMSVQDNSTSESGSNQDLILMELKKISQKFGQLEDQAAKDREVLTNLVSKVNQQGIQPGSKKVNATVSSTSLFNSSSQSQISNVARPKTRSETQTLTSNVQGVKNVHTLQQSDLILTTVAPNVNVISSASVQSAHGANQGVIQGSSRFHSGDINLRQHNHMQSQHRHMGATSYPTGAFALPQKLNTVRNMTATAQNTIDQGGIQAPIATWEAQSSVGNIQSATSVNNSYINTNNSVNTEGNNVVYFTAQQTASNQRPGPRDDRGQAAIGGDSCMQMAQMEGMEATETHMADHIIPSMQTLRQSVDVNRQVQQRYRELEEATRLGNQGNLDLLIEALTKKQKNEKIKVKWPQDLAFVGTMRKRPTYDQLTTCQWILGYLRIRQEETDSNIREHMIEYLTELMQDACDYSWESAKGAHSVLLHRMADGVVNWGQVKEVQKIRKRYAQTTATHSQDKHSKSQKVVPCLRYNKGTCLRTSDHEWQNLILKHICQFCHTQFNKIEQHPRKDCWKAPKENSKN